MAIEKVVVAAQLLVASSGLLAWAVLLWALIDSDTSTRLVTLALVELVPLLLVANHFLAGFEGDATSARRWGWVLVSLTWLPPLAVVVAYSYLDAAGARRRPNPYGIITDPPCRPSRHD